MRILLVDDDRNVAETVRRMIVAQGWVVDVVHDGAAGFDKALTGSFDVIVLDIMMPGRNGYEVVRDLRAARVWTPVLMLTAKDGEYDQADAFDLGADDYLTKPFSFVVLTARLRALARRNAVERPAVLTAGDLELDPAAHTAARGGVPLTLTPREFALLAFLLRHKGTAVSKTEIIDSVWDVNYEGEENIVEVYISYLRRRIDTPFGRKAIETVRGVGYRLAADGG
ncbi:MULTISPECIES: response regulator transcription factor [unclassified Gordonia (in: high G+C Gram-positive bacteria)]|uniref:response regulator transcription factor n=1 Tax=unclassified Gordonia (in: high G+C Gram-positive bacteria) TaxID=2657482 RepID=UPI001FFFE0E4|nr:MULTISPECIES: response regulator transcription factor [unclassified Gordonia (in: high G+C Gram-positive bacteria)]UQE75990.1 response regulator transcription factor [Gordonia sp. PP30]